jgi:hypothetical protein
LDQCVCPGAEIEKNRVRHRPKPVRLDIPLHTNATHARLTSDVRGLGFVLRFTGPGGISWKEQFLSYQEHLGPDMTLRDTAQWVERMMTVAGYRARRVKSGDKAVAAWVVWLAPRTR